MSFVPFCDLCSLEIKTGDFITLRCEQYPEEWNRIICYNCQDDPTIVELINGADANQSFKK